MADVDARDLVGSWKLVSIRASTTESGETVDLFGPEPLGCGVFTANGRWMVIITAAGLTEPTNDAERLALLAAIGAYSGRYRLDGNQITIDVDVTSTPRRAQEQQVRFAELTGNRLVLTTPKARLPWLGGREGVGIAVWEREP